ncbi:MAG: O-methyltransferase [Burkholderiales bacterium]
MTSANPAAPRDWTLGDMTFTLPPVLEDYVLAHSSGYDAVAAALAAETQALGDPAVMMLGKEQFALFRFLCGAMGVRRALDVGTFTGLSALAFAQGVGPGGSVVTIDRTDAWLPIARKHWNASGVASRIEVRIGEALDVLRDLRDRRGAPFDVAFIDVDKARVPEYVELAFDLLTPNGVAIVDNALWHGWVLDDTHSDADTTGMRDFNHAIAADARFESAVVPIADGMMLLRRR